MATPVITPVATVPTPPTVPANTGDWMQNIPGGDLQFDDLFNQPAPAAPAPSAPTPPAPQTPPAVAQPPVPDAPFLKAGSSVYKTREEAERSLQYKDEVVERLRNLEIQRTGVDPLTGKAVQLAPQGPVNYTQNQKAYVDDLVRAAEQAKTDPTKYFEVQQKFLFDSLQPIAPVIMDFTRNQAITTVSAEIKDFSTFMKSPEYAATLEMLPELRDAIHLAETDLNYAQRLPQFYKTAFWATQGRRTPELVQTAVSSAAAIPPPTRPTMTPTTPSLPATTPVVAESMQTSEGRKAIIERLRGTVENAKW